VSAHGHALTTTTNRTAAPRRARPCQAGGLCRLGATADIHSDFFGGAGAAADACASVDWCQPPLRGVVVFLGRVGGVRRRGSAAAAAAATTMASRGGGGGGGAEDSPSLGSLLAAFHSSSIDAVTRASIQVRCVAVSGTVCAVVLGGLCDLRLAGDDGERGARSVAYGVPRCAGGGCPLAWWRRLCSDLTRAPTGARHLVCLLSLSASPACRPFRPPPPHRSAW